MLRRKLKQWLPHPDTIRHQKWLAWCAPALTHPRLWHLHRRAVALGVAIGLITGMIPGPVQMLVAILIAIPLRANIPAAVFTTFYTNPFTFIPLYILAYNVGRFVTGDSSPFVAPKDIEWSWHGMQQLAPDLLHWIVGLGDTLLVGLAIQLTLFASLGYVATMVAWRIGVGFAWRRRARLRAQRQGSEG